MHLETFVHAHTQAHTNAHVHTNTRAHIYPCRAPSGARTRMCIHVHTSATTHHTHAHMCPCSCLQDPRWGAHAQAIASGAMWQAPRSGGHDDKAHPPIHPVKYSPGVCNAALTLRIGHTSLGCCLVLARAATLSLDPCHQNIHCW